MQEKNVSSVKIFWQERTDLNDHLPDLESEVLPIKLRSYLVAEVGNAPTISSL